ncbi:unnamed protein product [Calicophoron daubneyi]|uniref:Short-chain dehydrogenase/reductase 3 n=1 Tax=Calicophoron daubneyi TaxID=300641 RepID=A0AAV2TME5_CALDB
MPFDLKELFSFIAFVITTLIFVTVESFINACKWGFKKRRDLSREVILVTGAGGGIGRLLCVEFAKCCPTVVAWSHHQSKLEDTARLVLEKTGVIIKTYACDIRSRESIRQTAQRVLDEVGTVTILVNNAGILNAKRLMALEQSEIEDCFKINVISNFYIIQEFLPSMMGVKSKEDTPSSVALAKGHIVTVASVSSVIPCVGYSDYSASKAAVLSMSESLEMELALMNLDRKIRMTNVLPFVVNTEMTAGLKAKRPFLFPFIDAEYCAHRIVNAVRANERTVYITAQYSILPLLKWLCPAVTFRRMLNYVGAQEFADNIQEGRAKKVTTL